MAVRNHRIQLVSWMNFSKSRLSIKCRFMWKIHDEQMIPKRFGGMGYNGLDDAFSCYIDKMVRIV